ncbi:MAG: DUF5787 family protein [Natronomonas sp.]
MREFAFEMAVAAAVEETTDGLVARQLGTDGRILDLVEIEPGPEFDTRIELTAETIPPAVIQGAVGAGRARPATAVAGDGETAMAAVDRAIEVGFLEAEHRSGRRYVRQVARYPEWFDRLRAIENKPDLGRPGEMELQLRKDVSLAVFDEVILATHSHVTGAHRNRIPEEIGIWRVDPETGERDVLREPASLPVESETLAIGRTTPTRVDLEAIPPEEKRRIRCRIAERAYGKGWRPSLPACRRAEATGPPFRPDDALPYCGYKGRFVEQARECGPICDGYEPAEPPDGDPEAARERHSAWDADPAGRKRRQAGLDRFG